MKQDRISNVVDTIGKTPNQSNKKNFKKWIVERELWDNMKQQYLHHRGNRLKRN